jgi:hypothetical protein
LLGGRAYSNAGAVPMIRTGHGHSMDEHADPVVRAGLSGASMSGSANWVDAIRALVQSLGDLELVDLEREELGNPLDLSGNVGPAQVWPPPAGTIRW